MANIESEIIESEEYTIDIESEIHKIRRNCTHQDETRKGTTPTESTAEIF